MLIMLASRDVSRWRNTVYQECGKASLITVHFIDLKEFTVGKILYVNYIGKPLLGYFHKCERSHRREEPSWKQCGEVFNSSSCVQIHENVCVEEEPYVCKHCGKVFGQFGILRDMKLESINKYGTCSLSQDISLHINLHSGHNNGHFMGMLLIFVSFILHMNTV